MNNIFWFRRDLRISDNRALFYATKSAHVIALYIKDREFQARHTMSIAQQDFILQGLYLLRKKLEELNIPLIFLTAQKTKDIPELIEKTLRLYQATTLFLNNEYEADEKTRDAHVKKYLTQQGFKCESFDDQCILSPSLIKTGGGGIFKMFTPFKNAWLKKMKEYPIVLLDRPKKQSKLNFNNQETEILFNENKLWLAGEKEARHRLNYFIENHLKTYDINRDFPHINSTSQLSPYLANGMISPRECFLSANTVDSSGAETWKNELIWRDFYKYILVWFPRVSMNQPFQTITKKIKWDHDEAKLNAWKEGNTGFPIIDAAMRQLNQTGWMHNRLRMVVAMFFTKNLWFDWRVGEDYFMTKLIDGDLSANNGGWQWCASTGTDAAPYFRVFNPILQSEKYDPNGDFIRQYCPELKMLDKKSIHMPHERSPEKALLAHYPKPIVDLKKTRERAIKMFANLKGAVSEVKRFE